MGELLRRREKDGRLNNKQKHDLRPSAENVPLVVGLGAKVMPARGHLPAATEKLRGVNRETVKPGQGASGCAFSAYALYNTCNGDHFANPELRYSFTDKVWGAVGANLFGANLFGGKPWGQFGQLSRDDNVYLQVRYEF